jgi:hypothetical protein
MSPRTVLRWQRAGLISDVIPETDDWVLPRMRLDRPIAPPHEKGADGR